MYLLDTDHLSLIQRGTGAGRAILARRWAENRGLVALDLKRLQSGLGRGWSKSPAMFPCH